MYAALVESRKIPIKPALYALDPDEPIRIVLLQHPNSDIYNIASKVVAIVRVEDVNAKVNLYLEFGSLFQSIKMLYLRLWFLFQYQNVK